MSDSRITNYRVLHKISLILVVTFLKIEINKAITNDLRSNLNFTVIKIEFIKDPKKSNTQNLITDKTMIYLIYKPFSSLSHGRSVYHHIDWKIWYIYLNYLIITRISKLLLHMQQSLNNKVLNIYFTPKF